MKKLEFIVALGIAVIAAIATYWAFSSRIEGGGTPLVDKGGRVIVGTAGGQQVTASTIVFVDADGKATLTIKAGPPATLEIVDSKGRTKVIDLQKLASRASLFGVDE